MEPRHAEKRDGEEKTYVVTLYYLVVSLIYRAHESLLVLADDSTQRVDQNCVLIGKFRYVNGRLPIRRPSK